MKKRVHFPVLRNSPQDDFAETLQAAKAAHALLRDKRATVAIVVARIVDGVGVSMQASLVGGSEATAARIVEAAPTYLEEFIEREMGRTPAPEGEPS